MLRTFPLKKSVYKLYTVPVRYSADFLYSVSLPAKIASNSKQKKETLCLIAFSTL